MVVQLIGHFLDLVENHLSLFADAHQYDSFHRVVLLHESKLAEADGVADFDFGDILDKNRDSVVRAEHDIFDVRSISHQAESANVVELAALRIESAAGVGVVVGKLLDDLRNRNVVGEKLVRIEQHLVLHGGAAESRVIRYALDGAVAALEDPVLNGLQFLRRPIGALQNVAVDESARAEERRERRRDALGHGGIGDPFEGLLADEVGIGTVFEIHLYGGESVKRDGAQRVELRDTVHFELDGDGDEALYFFGSMSWPL